MKKIIIAGRSRSGKDLLARTLSEKTGLVRLKTHTDRPRRYPDEDLYHFHTKEESVGIPDSEKLFLTESVDGNQRWTTEDDMVSADFAILDTVGIPQAVEFWREHGFETMLVYVMAGRDHRIKASYDDAIRHGKDPSTAQREVMSREDVEGPQFSAFEKVLVDKELYTPSDITVCPNVGGATGMGEDILLIWNNKFSRVSLDNAMTAIVSFAAEMPKAAEKE